MDDQLVPLVVRVQIITQDLQMWRNTFYQAKKRHVVQKAIGADPQVLKQLEDEMVKCEIAIDKYQEELDALKGET